MLWVLIFIAAIVIIGTFVALAGKSTGKGSKIGFPYTPAQTLFSAAERSFLGALDQAVGPTYRVFGKVRVADLASIKPGLSPAARQGALNRIASKHVDFVVCRAADLFVVCAIELNDSSHSSKRAQARDELITRVCAAIDLPLIQVAAKRAYSVQELQAQLAAAVGPRSAIPG